MICFLDTSVLFSAITNESSAAAKWFDELSRQNTSVIIASLLAEVEVIRTARRQKFDLTITRGYLSSVEFIPINADICAQAMDLEAPLRGADAIHVATALRINGPDLVMATHDAEMARAAIDLGITVIDPVTDDPNRPPVV